jgi:SAM-dependent methyltransferase
MPSAEEIAAFYDEGYFSGAPERRGYLDYVGERETFLRSFAEKLDKIETMLAGRRGAKGGSGARKRLLDVGTAAGWCVEAARDRGWDAWGVEVSGYAVEAARERGLNVVQGDSLAMFAGQKFDVITLWDALEHLLDPSATLAEARSLLAEDGLLVFSTGDVGHFWSRLQGRQHRIYNPPQHLYYFTRKTMTRVAEKAGLGVLRIEPDEKVTNVHYVLHIARNLVDLKILTVVFDLLLRLVPDFRIRMKLIDNLVVYTTPAVRAARNGKSAHPHLQPGRPA